MTHADSTHRTPLVAWPTRTATIEVIEGGDAGTQVSGERIGVGTAEDNTLVLHDRAVSRYHLELEASEDGLRLRDVGSTNGTIFSGARIERAIVPPGAVIRIGGTTLRLGEGARATAPLHAGDRFGGLVGRSPTMRRLMADVERIAQSNASVLVHGESGVGKELVARALHDGPRANGPFEIVDCGAIVPTLIASELFGHERGAFTGADRTHTGAFERASGGTLFLDEIGELPTAVQANLLGALERRRFRRLGGRADITVDVRVVSATNRDLRAPVNEGQFRHDLYFRIGTIVLVVPPLRERLEDVPLLVEHFVREIGYAGDVDEIVTPDMMLILRTHHWPGNVRELRNAVEAILAMGRMPQLGGAVSAVAPGAPFQNYRAAREAVLAQFEKGYFTALIERCEGNVSRAAREAAMDRSYLIQLLARHKIGRT
jgi:DNA-binding NtrC family response regulator